MRKQPRPIMLLTEINDAIRLDTHAETRADRDEPLERVLAGRTRSPVFAAGSEDDESESTNRKRPVTLHNFSSGVNERGSEGGRKQAADNICHHPKARHPRVRIACPCSSSFGGGSRTEPGTLGGTRLRASASVPSRTSFTVFTRPHGTLTACRRSIQCCAPISLTRSANAAT